MAMKKQISSPLRNAVAQRNEKRRRERGAAVFIVMMAIVLLTGLGMWTMYSAGLVDQASGYARASRQTQYAAELGLQSATAYLSIPGFAEANYRLGLRAPDPCESNGGVVGFCKSIWDEEINDVTQGQLGVNVMDNIGAQGSFGPWTGAVPGGVAQAGALEGDFRVEMTDPINALVSGNSATASNYYRVTLSSYGQVRPHAGGAICSASENSAAGSLAVRAHAIIGPIAGTTSQ